MTGNQEINLAHASLELAKMSIALRKALSPLIETNPEARENIEMFNMAFNGFEQRINAMFDGMEGGNA